ncbi:hypothetical protein ACH5RR_041835 [Cinchona calisaya]|uniref:DUF4005 domain-containing protein n=1 Tax=Cinchona calisaya TaxID=153742 RepID=A0ABD2XVX2_9GENT
MGKKGGSSWLTVVKRAFRSPTKDTTNQKKSSRRREETEQDEEEEKKREKRRWLFRKPSNNEAKVTAHCAPAPPPPKNTPTPPQVLLPTDQRHAIAVAAATAAAAEAAVATAQAAVEIIRLTRSSNPTASSSVMKHDNYAAVVIQTAFRGYLARRALVALKGIVKLQALIRGQNVRKQAKMTLKCMQALLRLQTRMRDHQARLSHDGGSRKSMFAETTNLWGSKYLRDVRERKSLSRERICIPDDWNECPRTLEELEAVMQARKEAAFKRESSLAYAFSQQIWDSDSGYDEKEVGGDERTNWLDKWMATKQWDTCSRGSTGHKRDSIKTVEMDISAGKPQYSSYSVNGRKIQHQSTPHNQKQAAPHPPTASPRHRSSSSMMVQPPVTPSPSRTRPVLARPSSPRSYSAANTPSLRSMQRLNSSISRYSVSTTNEGNNNNNGNANSSINMPNYMAATESAKSRVRSQSAPRQRPSTPEKERGVKKRLSFPVPSEPNNLRSPSFKSVQAGYVGMMDLQSNQSFYTDSIGGEISPCSTTDLRRWLR